MPSMLQTSMQPSQITLPDSLATPIQKKPWIAVTLNAIFPGLGHMYLDDPQTASGFMCTTGVGLGLIYGNVMPNKPALELTAATLSATSFYSTYASYRDARRCNGSFQYSYKMPTDSLADLTLAPFKWNIIKKPEVWGGMLGFLAAGTAIGYFLYPDEAKIRIHSASTATPPIIALPVGLGEEAFFRGFLQSSISEISNPLAGTIVSSLIFGAAHINNGDGIPSSERWRYYAFSLPFITAVGAYCGWLTHENRSLQESVALHTWYDFILFALGALGNEAMMTGRPGFAFSTSF